MQQEANVTVGKLKCAGTRKYEETALPTSTCTSLKRRGAFVDGFYFTREDNSRKLSSSYCKMSNPGKLVVKV